MTTDQLYTEKLRQAVHDFIKKNWTKAHQVSYGDAYLGIESIDNKDSFYNDLRDEIEEVLKSKFGLAKASTLSISKDTIRRFLDHNYHKSFSEKNKDVLSIFIGYKDFKDFCINVKSEKAKNWPLKRIVLVGLLVLVILGGWGIRTYSSFRANVPYFEIAKDSELEISNKLKFNYDLKDLSFTKAMLEIDGQVEFLKERKGDISFFARTPGLKRVKLRVDDKVITEKRFLVLNNEWWGSVNLTVPILDKSFLNDGVMQLAYKSLLPNTEEVYAGFQLNKDFGISADEMIFETTVKNSKENGGFWAYDVSINLEGSKEQMSFNLLDPNALIYAKMKIAQTSFDSPKERMALNGMGVYMKEWTKVKVKLKDHLAQIFINEEMAFESEYKGDLCDLTGILYYLKGRGMVDLAISV
jgi:hypothetical protein